MAMAEEPWPRCASNHSPNTNNFQDLGGSILLLLGLIICINIGINMVTLLWLRLRGFLHCMFCRIVCEKEASKSSSHRKKTRPPKQSSPAVHLRCTMDPLKMTLTPPPTRRHCHRSSSSRCAHHPTTWAPDADNEKPLHQHPAICSHNWDRPPDWEGFQSAHEAWGPWAQDTVEPPPQAIHFQQTIKARPLKREMRSDLALEAYVYPVNPPAAGPHVLNRKNSGGGTGVEGEQEQCSPAPPAPPPIRGPAMVPDVPRRPSSVRIAYDARDVRRRLRELTREVEALSHGYPMPCGSSTAEGMGKDWVYRPLAER